MFARNRGLIKYFLLTLGLFLVITSCTAVDPTINGGTGDGTDRGTLMFKIYVDDTGVYELSTADLSEIEDTFAISKSDQFAFYSNGDIIPHWAEKVDREVVLRFLGIRSESLYTAENIYWLVVCKSGSDCPSPPESLIDRAPAGDEILDSSEKLADNLKFSSETHIKNIRLEENLLYNPQVEGEEHWFWASLTAPTAQNYEINLPLVAEGIARLRISGWASTQGAVNPDHHILLYLNNQLILDQTWDGKGEFDFVTEIPQGVLMEGVNQIELRAPGDTGVPADIYLLDSFEIAYSSYLRPIEGRLTFMSHGEEQVLAGFSDVVNVYDVSDPLNPVQMGSWDQDSISFSGEKGHIYTAVGSGGYLAPTRIEKAVLTPDLRVSSNAADYIAVGPSELLTPIDDLLDLREEGGFRSISVPLEAIYDQFGGGFPEPEAIRGFLQYAWMNWDDSPDYLLLVGDATYDPKGYISTSEANRLPVFLVNTVYGGQTASDVGYSQLSGERWIQSEQNTRHEIAVGRIPAQNLVQVRVFVDKILEYERSIKELSDNGTIDKGILAIADGQDASFQSDAQYFLDLFPEQYQKSIIAPQPGQDGVNLEIINQISAGNHLVAYFGHGSVNMWGKDRLFSVEDVSALPSDSQLPVILNLTCLTGLFTHPSTESLAEALLWKEEGGAVAVLAPTSLTLPTDQSFLVDELTSAILSDPDIPIGEVLRLARQQIPADTRGLRDVLQTFLLFGDPALKLHLSERSP